MFTPLLSRQVTAVLTLLIIGSIPIQSANAIDLAKRIPWTQSKLAGSPEPPLPYTLERTLTRAPLQSVIYVAPEPGTDQLWAVERGGDGATPSRIVRIRNSPDADKKETLWSITNRLIYGLTFHPRYVENGQVFVFHNGPWQSADRSNRISRFTVSRTAPQLLDVGSEVPIIEWKSGGHDGGDLAFGRDGMLYITSGDGTSDSDGWDSGQDMTRLLGGVLRIDVEGKEGDRNYRVPGDNPFWRVAGARPEKWAFGLRNPWRMSIDPVSGAIWVGNNGQDLWETAHFIRKGENYGWSVYEGNHPFYLNRRLGPAPLTPPTIEHSHAEFRSLTGGVVYRGARFPELEGLYIYGDYSTGRIWAAKHDGEKLLWKKEIADTSVQVASFRVDQNGELLIVDLVEGLWRLTRNKVSPVASSFPVRLSETGLFESAKEHRLAAGVIPYSVQAAGWADGAEAERFAAIPGDGKAGYKNSKGWDFPDGTVLGQTLTLPATGEGNSTQRIETRILLRQQGEWAGYTYRWRPDASDADLVALSGADIQLRVGSENRDWRIPARSECLLCHSRAAGFVLGLCEPQMNRDHPYDGGVRTNQIQAWLKLGVLTNGPSQSPSQWSRLADPQDATAPLEHRARSYLHANCSACHVDAGGGNSRMDLDISAKAEKVQLVDARPQHQTFNIANAMLVAPGEPDRSILIRRLSQRGPGQMPPLVSRRVDLAAVELFRNWIRQMPSTQRKVREWTVADLISVTNQLQTGRSVEKGRAAFRDTGCVQCHRLGGDGGSVGPDLTGLGKRMSVREVLESLVEPSKAIADAYATFEVESRDGTVVSGRIEREDAETVAVRPLSGFEEAAILKKSDIARRTRLSVSTMPEGVLNTLELDAVLDLVAYVLSDGK